MSASTILVPTYRAVATQFLPMRHGEGRRFLTNPAICGSSEPGTLLGNVMCLGGQYYVTGPAFPADGEPAMRHAVLAGRAAVQRYNCRQREPRQIYTLDTHSAALATLWELLAAHYAIGDAVEQVQEHELRGATQRHQAYEQALAEQEHLNQWSSASDQAHESNGNNPAINRADDWIPDYPPQPGEDLADNQDNEEYPEYPEDEQRDYLDDNEQDAEAEALGDLYNSQFDD